MRLQNGVACARDKSQVQLFGRIPPGSIGTASCCPPATDACCSYLAIVSFLWVVSTEDYVILGYGKTVQVLRHTPSEILICRVLRLGVSEQIGEVLSFVSLCSSL